MRQWFILLWVMVGTMGYVQAYPEFQQEIRKISGRSINCSMCHVHPDGPQGLKHGQIGGLTGEENSALGAARQAFKPGVNVNSPILNPFGNKMVYDLGREKIIQLKTQPALLFETLLPESDIDGDGISDADEIKDGTHPVNALDGLPQKLFIYNFTKNGFHILMMVLATGTGLFGLYNLLLWLSIKVKKED